MPESTFSDEAIYKATDAVRDELRVIIGKRLSEEPAGNILFIPLEDITSLDTFNDELQIEVIKQLENYSGAAHPGAQHPIPSPFRLYPRFVSGVVEVLIQSYEVRVTPEVHLAWETAFIAGKEAPNKGRFSFMVPSSVAECYKHMAPKQKTTFRELLRVHLRNERLQVIGNVHLPILQLRRGV